MSERMRLRCIGEPVSWLRLERYHLGELEAALRTSIEAHLAACPACAACLRRIESDDAAPLPAFELPSQPTTAAVSGGRVVRFSRGRASSVFGGLAIAAIALLGVGRAWLRRTGTVDSPGSPRVKGGDVSFALVRDDGTQINEERGVFRDGDRFKVVVTCPPTMQASFDVVVLDEAGASFPLAQVPVLACGNAVPLPGALRLTGTANEHVCVVWNKDGAIERPREGASAREERLGGESLCKDLHAVQAGP